MKKLLSLFIIILCILSFGFSIYFLTYCIAYCESSTNSKNYALFLISLFLVSVKLLSQGNIVHSEITKEDIEIIKEFMEQILEIFKNIKE